MRVEQDTWWLLISFLSDKTRISPLRDVCKQQQGYNYYSLYGHVLYWAPGRPDQRENYLSASWGKYFDVGIGEII